MTKKSAFCVALVLGGCASTAELSDRQPSATYQSTKSREAVAECLMNRLGSDALVPEKVVAGGVTTVGFTGHDGMTRPGIYLFTIKDAGGGSEIEMRTMKGLWKLRSPLAETCF